MIGWGKREERRKTSRFPVASSAAQLPVAIVRQDANSAIGQLVDLSQQGAKLCLATVLQFSEQVILRFVLPSQGISLAVPSTIVWTRTATDGQYMVGCAFEETIPNSVIDRLAGTGLINRRRHPRFHANNVRGQAQWQLNTETVPVTIKDYSVGGFRMECEKPGVTNQRVRVQFESGESVFGVVKWSSRKEGRFEFGCEFLQVSNGSDGASVIQRLCENPVDAEAVA